MKDEIRCILQDAHEAFKRVPTISLQNGIGFEEESKDEYHKRLEHNFFVYANAIEQIENLVEK